MKKLLVCQHVAYELLGTLHPLLKRAGFRIRYVNFDRHPHAEPEVDGYHGLVVLGGPMGVDQVDKHPHIETELRLIGDAIDRQVPVLGICLGAQLLAKTLGARVMKNPEKEIGWYDVSPTEAGKADPLMCEIRPGEKIFQWHGDTFELPAGAVHLAESEACANQAFRYGDNIYGFQFHLEVDEAMIGRWLEVPHHVNEIAELDGQIDPNRIREETPLYIDRLKELSDFTFGRFVDLLGIKKKHRMLPSR